ncbi:hypothetical protein PPERSA_10557 [Pseudocohnilembus persalinus]|uniref:FGFR1 oncogene partner (FOP) N-terminal dimerisation domain-containing protein n=1 Tax=Pseudocohnilembus persalinus TaxID=266149 RepID=A0A0V0Q959_PSEPJ|nr:hypothetical protein PPERSA_10557 [Pseudocohnilembus persalinus]|eukprot:KRW98786.1 hypothetical protein PPERSA_10557 [Pseudocohnilembus persalinus]
MSAIGQLKTIVNTKLEDTGYLDNLRAELKTKVFNIIEQQDAGIRDRAGFQWEHPNVEKLHSLKEGLIGLNLIGEFLEHFKLQYSLSVYKKEIRLRDFPRDDLIDNLKIKSQTNHNTPILLHIIKEYIKYNQMSSSGVFQHQQHSYNGLDSSFKKNQNSNDSFQNILPSNLKDELNKKKSNEMREQQEALQKKIQEQQEQEDREKRLKEYEEEQERLRILREEEEEAERKRQEEQERKERVEAEYKKLEEERRQKEEEEQKKKEKEEQRRLEKEKALKKKKKPKTAVNKIRGAKEQDEDHLANIYGAAITGIPQNYDMYDDQGQDMYGDDPYAFDMAQAQNAYGDEGGFKYSQFGGDPYAAIDLGGGDKNDAGQEGQGDDKQKKDDIENFEYQMDEEIEDIDYFGESNNTNQYQMGDKDKKNPMFTSSEDFYGASQSMGQDYSVDSDAIENYDHYEKIIRKI